MSDNCNKSLGPYIINFKEKLITNKSLEIITYFYMCFFGFFNHYVLSCLKNNKKLLGLYSLTRRLKIRLCCIFLIHIASDKHFKITFFRTVTVFLLYGTRNPIIFYV